ncbi:DUF2167 domain-containing protein [Gynurincola endophyticus]|uniref:DUF2167 domain-containing protein n=1 Tax=Gynurincola endophyticus TaxID=2479004 RepID=UPI000F8D249B|nr:DUF2167 domain-containing protein [Gynurincola endophyticus]
MRSYPMTLLLLFVSFFALANDTTKVAQQQEAESNIKYITEPSITYQNYIKINVPKGFKLLDRESANYVSEEIFQNQPDKDLLGLLLKMDEEENIIYSVYISENKEGYIEDKDASKIDKNEILKEQQKSEKEFYKQNPDIPVKLYFTGWGMDPEYDQPNHTLHFAKVFREGSSDESVLNYQLYKLNKYGYVNITVAADTALLGMIREDIPVLYDMVAYENQSGYGDFDPSTGSYAQWTVGGLVAGKILAKTGILALILKNIKLVLIGIGAAFYAIVRFFKRKKKDEIIVENPENN